MRNFRSVTRELIFLAGLPAALAAGLFNTGMEAPRSEVVTSLPEPAPPSWAPASSPWAVPAAIDHESGVR